MKARGSVVVATIAAMVVGLSATGIGQAADRGGEPAAAATKAPKPKAKRGPRGPRGAIGPIGPVGGAGKDGAPGPAGPGAVIAIDNLALANSSVNHDPVFAFVGQTLTADFDALTTAQVTASLEFASRDGKKIESAFAVCAKPTSGTDMFAFRAINVRFQARAENYFAQTDSVIIQGLQPGRYTIGACTAQETMNTGHGQGAATVILAEAEGGRST
jgi:hypothetical protein